MKLLYCQDCGDIIAPYNDRLKPRFCECRRHAVWWIEPARGTLRVCDCSYPGGYPARARAFVIGLTNLLLHYPSEDTPSAGEVQRLIDEHGDNYVFKTTRSLVIRMRPGGSSDTAWAPLPHENQVSASEKTESHS
jgi:hypothetical protein